MFNIFKNTKFGISYYSIPPYSPSNSLFFINPAANISNKITFEKEIHQTIATYFIKLNGVLKMSAFPTNIVDTQIYFWNKFKVIPNYTYQINLHKSTETEDFSVRCF